MDNFSNGNRNTFDGLIMPKAASADTVDFSTSQIITEDLNKVLEYHVLANDAILKHHEIFDTIFRASEKIRVNQKYTYEQRVREMQQLHDQAMQDLVNRTYTNPITVTFVPQDAEVEESMEAYIMQSIETGIPLHELLPVSLLASRLEHFSSGESSSDGTSSESVTTMEGEVTSSSGASTCSGDITDTSGDSAFSDLMSELSSIWSDDDSNPGA